MKITLNKVIVALVIIGSFVFANVLYIDNVRTKKEANVEALIANQKQPYDLHLDENFGWIIHLASVVSAGFCVCAIFKEEKDKEDVQEI